MSVYCLFSGEELLVLGRVEVKFKKQHIFDALLPELSLVPKLWLWATPTTVEKQFSVAFQGYNINISVTKNLSNIYIYIYDV